LIIGFIIVFILQKLNETGKITIEKFEFIDKSRKNKIFSISLVFFFFLGLLYMAFVEGSGVPLNFIFIATFISIIPVYISRQNNKIDYLVQDRVRTLKRAKEHTEKILFNVFPKSVAVELNEKGSVLPKGFANVTLLFSDFKNFTNTSSTMSPEKLVGELNELFHSFDNVIEESGVEKIKTIGDAYMVASGVPNYESSHAEKCIETGLKMIEVLKERNISTGIKWDMRIGIHTGSVVAGLVGKSRFTYDLWGDTVNIASRMESSSEPGMINVSGITYDLVKDIYDFDYRGKVDIKGKGEIDMYFVNKRLDN
jgi:class 3 adenylate cyclase